MDKCAILLSLGVVVGDPYPVTDKQGMQKGGGGFRAGGGLRAAAASEEQELEDRTRGLYRSTSQQQSLLLAGKAA